MLVRDAIQAKLGWAEKDTGEALTIDLPRKLQPDPSLARTSVLRRLSTSRLFAFGDRGGVLKAAQDRSGRSFRLDVRQRVIVKALVSRHAGAGGATRGAALRAQVAYLGRSGAGEDGNRASFFDRSADSVEPQAATSGWSEDRHHFRFIVSPEYGDRISDLRGYTREVMRRVSDDLGEPELAWIGTCHFDTDQPHAHVLVRGRRASGRDLVIPRNYIGYGFRARAQEVAHELLGDLSRADAERRIWRETEVERFTGFDRRLVQAADENCRVDDGVGGSDAWSALTRGRLRHLERLGLATREGARYRLDRDLEARLRGLQLQKDVMRLRHQRLLNGAREVGELNAQQLRGQVVRSGWHDELGGSPYVLVRDAAGVEHLAHLRLGQTPPEGGSFVELVRDVRGTYAVDLGRAVPDRSR